ncbi:alpha-amylase family glycosyl hydrolase [bacterium]
MIVYAKIQDFTRLEVCIQPMTSKLNIQSIDITPQVEVLNLKKQGNIFIIQTSPFDLKESYTLKIENIGERRIEPAGVLDYFHSAKPLGHTQTDHQHIFRLFAPRAKWVQLILFKNVSEHCDAQLNMRKDNDGIWEIEVGDLGDCLYYGYRLDGPNDETELYDPSVVLADPYSRAVVTLNHFLHPSKTLLHPPQKFDWEGDSWLTHRKDDLIIYEMHVRDMTLHASSGISQEKRGTYLGMTSTNGQGGLNHLLKLGVNCVELMPIQEFGNIEVDYKNEDLDVFNDWNVYERNHWGYMTSYFFAPESYYATGGTIQANEYIGEDGRAMTELKTLVKTLHQHGIAVIMDVVYNHVSQYDLNPFKYVDKKYYFRLDHDQKLHSKSGCGNDFKTERPMARKLIIDSLLYWMNEYHIDGFRFDLATMIDSETLEVLTETLREVNPNVILIAEPWGGGKYDLHGFSKLDWGAWNDLFRNGIKGQNPHDGLGMLFGHFWNGQNMNHIQNFISGSTQSGGGPFLESGHSINYLESHDDHSLGDFIRIGLREVDVNQPVKDLEKHAKLSENQLRLHKLAALFLMVSQGTVMMHAGQEFGRSKVIAKSKLPEIYAGFIDHNSYNKDDETNWINYEHMRLNQELVDYYAGLIAIRRKYPFLRHAQKGKLTFLTTSSNLMVAYRVTGSKEKSIMVLLNCHRQDAYAMQLPPGPWDVLADVQHAKPDPIRRLMTDTVTLGPSTGLILIQYSDQNQGEFDA